MFGTNDTAGEHPSGLSWIHGAADEEHARDLLAAFFDSASPADLQTFTFESEPTVMAPHYHTEDITAYIVSGRLAFYVGPGFGDRVEVETGDCVFVPAMLPHGEEVLGEEKVVAVVASLVPFDTDEV